MAHGRPMQARSLQIKDALEGKQAGDNVTFELQPDEQERFFRFTQRARTVAKNLNMKIGVVADRTDKTKAVVTIKQTDVDPAEFGRKTGKRGRPKKEDIPEPVEVETVEAIQEEPVQDAQPVQDEEPVAAIPPDPCIIRNVGEDTLVKEEVVAGDMADIARSLSDTENEIAALGYHTLNAMNVPVLCQALLRAARLSVQQAQDIWDAARNFGNFNTIENAN